jgi:group I intron endonuclease
MIGIYKITNPNGRIYIGQSTNIEARWDVYHRLKCKDQPSLYNSLQKYGPENHKYEVIEECIAEDLDKKEIFWGQHYDVLSNKHLNNRLGRGFGSFDSEETRQKKSECHKGRSNYWLKGKTLSEEQKEKISKAKKGISNTVTKTRKDKGISKTYHVEAIIKAKSIPLMQYDLDKNFIKEWPSGAVAAKYLGLAQSNIHNASIDKTKSCGGFIWVKKETIL